ncbi:MAG TPA: ATP-binding protein, partial [bacterium]|nr:ATP-binding protein [bacterium]
IALPEQGIKDLLWDEAQRSLFRETFLPSDKQSWNDDKLKALGEISLDRSPDPAVRKVISLMTSSHTDSALIRLSGEDKLIAFCPIPATGWSIGIIIPLHEWLSSTEIVRKTIAQGANVIIRKFLFFIIAVICISVIAAILLHLRLIRPLTVFIRKLETVSWDALNFDGHSIVRRDEIGQLYEKFGGMIIELKKARDEVMEKAAALSRINNDLQAKSVSLFASNAELERAKDELRLWASSLERKVAERTAQVEAMQQQLLRSEKLSALGKLAGSLSHELRNPLGVITNAVYYLTLPGITVSEASLRENLFIIKRQVELANLIVENALFFANPKTPDVTHENVSYAIKEAIADLLVPRRVHLETQFKSARTVPYDTFLIKCVFMNVLKNAIEAIKDEGTVTVTTEDASDGVQVTVKDTGSGISQECLSKLFEPLFTSKPRGIGLGLFIARNIVERHKGTISITSPPGAGTNVTIRLPYA